ncbi:MAG: protein kinase [Bryobacteraceae bacterium]
MAFQIGDRAGDYEILAILGAGGMGKVYKVRNVISERLEAMKVLLPNLESDPDLADRFMREIKVQASLAHPNIAALHTAQRIENQLVMMMEFVEGVTIEQEMHAGAISIEKGVEYISQVLSALAYAHARGVVHRDIKPANMMLTPSGVVKLMDFGIAKISADPKLTQTGRTLGSLYYMSPEQINGFALDARSDLYSLGVSLYEIVTGTRPFKGDSDFSIMAAHLNSVPVPPLQIDPRLPPMLNEIVMMSFAKDPAQRFQTADAFRNALLSLHLGAEANIPTRPAPAQVQAPPTGPPSPQPARTGSLRGLYMALGSLATIAAMVLVAVQGPKYFQPSGAAGPPMVASSKTTQSNPIPAAPPPQVQEPAPSPAAEESAVPTADKSAVASVSRKPDLPSIAARKPQQQDAVPQLTAQIRQAVPPQLEPQRQTPASAAVVAPSAPEPIRNDDGKSAAIREQREVLMLLDTRANSIKGSLQTLQQQQARSGLSLRGDIVTAQQRMEAYLNEAEADVKAGDPTTMKKHLASAEREIEKLEKFLGR